MKTQMAILFFFILLVFTRNTEAQSTDLPVLETLAPLEHEAQLAKFVAQIIEHNDYQRTTLDQALSARIVDHYLNALDPQKMYFTEPDVATFSSDRESIGPAIYRDDLHFPFQVFNLYQRRVIERFTFSRELLKHPMDFTVDESYDDDRENIPREKSTADLRDLWRKLVKEDYLQLKLNGEDSQRITEQLDKRYSQLLAGVYKFRSEDVFQIFMDVYTTSVEPHTDYLGLKSAEEFEIEMQMSLVGIGAKFQQHGDYLAIRELAPGGPAAVSGQLHIGDRLVGVGQGSTGPMVNVVGWRIDDVGSQVRGAKGSTVRLDILPGTAGVKGKVRAVTLVRNKVSFTEDSAHKSIVQIEDGTSIRKVGVISLPSFYQDFAARSNGEKNYKSASGDVARLLEELKHAGVDSVLVDLRDNGGGSLDEAISLAGLFIGKKPIVQERNADGDIHISSADNDSVAWDGPLAVLINRESASASEIFAAAVQDYGRGIILGQTSFGKGTVQTVLNLDHITHNTKPEFGELKITVAQFFRVNGASTQLRGVVPDISLPPIAGSGTFAESNFDNAAPWSEIKPAAYSRNVALDRLMPALLRNHDARIKEDADFRLLAEENERFNQMKQNHFISLNEATRRKERDAEEARSGTAGQAHHVAQPGNDALLEHKMASVPDYKQGAGATGQVGQLPSEPELKDVKDVWLKEAAHILVDLSHLQSDQAQLKM